MTDLKQAAEMALEALDWVVKDNDSYDPFDDRWDDVHKAVLALRQALDQLPDTTKMIEPSIIIVGWMYEDQLPEIYPYEEMFQFSVVDGVRMFPVYAPKAEPDTGTDRGAWDDVPDATKWVDELRGDDEELPPVKTYCGGKPNYCQPEESPNSTTDVVEPEEWDHPPQRDCGCKHCKEYWSDVYGVEPVAWATIKNGYPTAWAWNPEYVKTNPNMSIELYTTPPKREWQGLTDDERRAIMRQFGVWTFSNEWLACLEVEVKLKEKNHDSRI